MLLTVNVIYQKSSWNKEKKSDIENEDKANALLKFLSFTFMCEHTLEKLVHYYAFASVTVSDVAPCFRYFLLLKKKAK